MIKGPTPPFGSKNYPKKQKEDDLVTALMQEWRTVLIADYAPLTPMNVAIRYYAVLGATGRVFEALHRSKVNLGKKIMPFDFLSGIRNSIYHAPKPFLQLNAENGEFITFFSHLYEYCRQELGAITGTDHLPRLLCPIDVAEREKPYFKAAIDYAMKEGKIQRIRVRDELRASVKDYHDKIIQLIEHFHCQPGFLVQEDTPAAYKCSDTIRASAVGALLAWFSLDVSCALKGDFYQSKEIKRKASLPKEAKRAIVQEHAEFISAGKLYRYEQVSLEAILKRFSIESISGEILQLNIEHAIEAGKVKLVKSLVPQWSSHPFVLNIEGGQDPIKGKWLIKAASLGCLPVVELLFKVPERNTWRAFSLVNAAKNGHEPVVRWLLQHMPCSEDLLKYSMVIAKENGQNTMVALLERGDEQEQALMKQLSDLLLADSSEEQSSEFISHRSFLHRAFIGSRNSNSESESAPLTQKRAHAKK
jgi:hypothetical protein